MKRYSSSLRLKEIMEKQGLKQVDILNKALPYCAKYNVKMNKSDISQYVSGKVEPGQDKLAVLSMALGVSEGWLMGLDVSPSRKDSISIAEKDFDFYYKYSMLSEEEKEIIMDLINSMLLRKKSEN